MNTTMPTTQTQTPDGAGGPASSNGQEPRAVVEEPQAAPQAPETAGQPAASAAPPAASGGGGPETFNRARKAAAIMVALGPDVSSKVLEHMDETEVEHLAFEIATLGKVENDDVKGILEEFYTEAIAHRELVRGGIAHARNLLRRWRGDSGDEIVDRLLASVDVAPFGFLRHVDPHQLIQYFHEEHPQAVALVLAHLPAKQSAAVLAGLEPDVQQDVALRVATMDRTSPEVIQRLEEAIQQRLGVIGSPDAFTKKDGVRDLAAILNRADRGTERAIIGTLEMASPELAEQVRGLMFVFEDIVDLDDRTIQRILRDVDSDTLVLALKGVRDDVHEVIMRNLSERAAQNIEEELELLGPVRIRDVEGAQSDVARHIRQLEEQGEIIVNRGEGMIE